MNPATSPAHAGGQSSALSPSPATVAGAGEPEGGLSAMNIPHVSFLGLVAQAAYAQAAGLILSILSGPGGGKTSAFHAIGDALGIPRERRRKVNFSGAAPSEVSGFAVPQDGGRLKWDAPDWLPLASEWGDAPFLLMADEFSDWDGAVQSLFRGVVDPDGQPAIGPHLLPAGLFVILTGNRSIDGSRNSRTISAPITRRAVTVELVPDREEVLTHLAGKGLGSTVAWQFLNFASNEQAAGLFAPPVPAPWDGAPFPTPAGWEAAARMEVIGDGDALRTAWAGALGEAAADALWAFRQAVHRWSPSVAAVRAGTERLDPYGDALKASAVTAAAVRIAVRETLADPAASVAAGAVDWLVDLLAQAGPERGQAGYRSALASGIPLDTHPRSALFTPAPL